MKYRWLLLIPLVAFAAMGKDGHRKYGMAGCGAGSVLMGADGGQISAATTNGLGFGVIGLWIDTQLMGIVSGTSNCELDAAEKSAMREEIFVSSNLASLHKEIAQGEGETLRAFAATLGCKNEEFPTFASQLQASQKEIFEAPGAVAILETTKEVLQKNETLKTACGLSS